jgi:hypothetical protein
VWCGGISKKFQVGQNRAQGTALKNYYFALLFLGAESRDANEQAR